MYGFSEAARLLWLKLSQTMCQSQWQASLLESAFFLRRHAGQLVGMAVMHVDDLLLARHQDWSREEVLGTVATEFQWEWSQDSFTFRGRETQATEQGFTVRMRDYASSIVGTVIPSDRRSSSRRP